MFNRSNITPLPATETEVKAIFSLYDNNKLKAKILLHNNANEKSVKSGELAKYKVIHLLHMALLIQRNQTFSLLLAQIQRREDGIYTREIYNLKLNADLRYYQHVKPAR